MAAPDVIKVIVTHRGAAVAKYGADGFDRIGEAVDALARTDLRRGVTTSLFALDSTDDAAKVSGVPVAQASDSAAVKAAIDAIFAAWNPAYLVLLGGPELVPQLQLSCPLWTGNPGDDPDQVVASDLPYACDTPFSASATAYRGPTRVIGRIPDLTGATDPSALLTQLAAAAGATTTERPASLPVFVLSTKTWLASTQLSLGKLPGVAATVRICPTDGPIWTKGDLAPALHFVNCHGGEFDPNWYGEATSGQQNLPPALEARLLPQAVTAGTVVAAECCYGAALWSPAAAGGQPSVALSYLLQGAGGVFGSSTTSYGPADSNEYADVLCRLFCEEVLAGASLGRAVLSARQRFVQGQSFLDPTDVKTLAQFNLLGDPSYQPFGAVDSPEVRPTPLGFAMPSASIESVTPGVGSRRLMLRSVGTALTRSTTVCSDEPQPRSSMSRARLGRLLGGELPVETRIRSYRSLAAPVAAQAAPAPTAHVAFVPTADDAARSIVVVRDEPGSEPQIRVAVRR